MNRRLLIVARDIHISKQLVVMHKHQRTPMSFPKPRLFLGEEYRQNKEQQPDATTSSHKSWALYG